MVSVIHFGWFVAIASIGGLALIFGWRSSGDSQTKAQRRPRNKRLAQSGQSQHDRVQLNLNDDVDESISMPVSHEQDDSDTTNAEEQRKQPIVLHVLAGKGQAFKGYK